jgi:hypothetical protein
MIFDGIKQICKEIGEFLFMWVGFIVVATVAILFVVAFFMGAYGLSRGLAKGDWPYKYYSPSSDKTTMIRYCKTYLRFSDSEISCNNYDSLEAFKLDNNLTDLPKDPNKIQIAHSFTIDDYLRSNQ